jgi:hypothetical protein
MSTVHHCNKASCGRNDPPLVDDPGAKDHMTEVEGGGMQVLEVDSDVVVSSSERKLFFFGCVTCIRKFGCCCVSTCRHWIKFVVEQGSSG